MLQLSSFQSIFHKSRFTISQLSLSLSLSRCIWLFYDGISETWPTRFTFEFEITIVSNCSFIAPLPFFVDASALNVLESRRDRGNIYRVCWCLIWLLWIERNVDRIVSFFLRFLSAPQFEFLGRTIKWRWNIAFEVSTDLTMNIKRRKS